MSDRTVKQTVLGILSAVTEPASLDMAAAFAGVAESEVAAVVADPQNGIVEQDGLYIASEKTRAAQGDLRWAHNKIASSLLKSLYSDFTP